MLGGVGIGLAIAFALWAEPAWANSWPPMAVLLLPLPLFASLVSFGFGMVAIITLETVVVARRSSLGRKRAFELVASGNLISLLAGLIVALGMAALPYVSLRSNDPLWLTNYCVMGLTALTVGLTGLASAATLFWLREGRPRSPHRRRWAIGRSLLGVLGWAIIFLGLFFLLAAVGAVQPLWLKLPLAWVYFVIGWTMSWVIESAWVGLWCRRSLTQTQLSQLMKTVAIANLRSYAYIAVPITLGLFWLNGQLSGRW